MKLIVIVTAEEGIVKGGWEIFYWAKNEYIKIAGVNFDWTKSQIDLL
ncbi:MAG: hypothetical protein NC400_13100 [Clostridium sp.]|nr:hypothetical protein [Clostridium sp.]